MIASPLKGSKWKIDFFFLTFLRGPEGAAAKNLTHFIEKNPGLNLDWIPGCIH